MKMGMAGLLKFNNTMLALRGERWNYLLVVGVVAALALLFASSVFINIYRLAELVVSSSQEVSTLSKIHNRINLNQNVNTTTNDQTKANEKNLFGSSPPSSVMTNSQFTVVGITYTDEDPSKAEAFITSDSGEDGIYRVGDKLPQGATVESISPDVVTLFYNGALQSLTLQWEEQDQSPQQSNSQQPLMNNQNDEVQNLPDSIKSQLKHEE